MAEIPDILQILQGLDPLTLGLGVILVVVIVSLLIIVVRRKRKMKKQTREQIMQDLEEIKSEVTGEKPAKPKSEYYGDYGRDVRATEKLVSKEPDFDLEPKRMEPEPEQEPVEAENHINYQDKIRNLVDTLSRRLGRLKVEKKEIAEKNESLKTRWEDIQREEREINRILATMQRQEQE